MLDRKPAGSGHSLNPTPLVEQRRLHSRPVAAQRIDLGVFDGHWLATRLPCIARRLWLRLADTVKGWPERFDGPLMPAAADHQHQGFGIGLPSPRVRPCYPLRHALLACLVLRRARIVAAQF